MKKVIIFTILMTCSLQGMETNQHLDALKKYKEAKKEWQQWLEPIECLCGVPEEIREQVQWREEQKSKAFERFAEARFVLKGIECIIAHQKRDAALTHLKDNNRLNAGPSLLSVDPQVIFNQADEEAKEARRNYIYAEAAAKAAKYAMTAQINKNAANNTSLDPQSMPNDTLYKGSLIVSAFAGSVVTAVIGLIAIKYLGLKRVDVKENQNKEKL